MEFKKGDIVDCIAARDERNITINTTYLVIEDEEEGIFPNCPYVTVQGNSGKPLLCHASRFKLKE